MGVKPKEQLSKGSDSQIWDYYQNIVWSMHVAIFRRNKNVARVECNWNVMYIWVVAIVGLFKCKNVKSIHIELERERHKYSLTTIVYINLS